MRLQADSFCSHRRNGVLMRCLRMTPIETCLVGDPRRIDGSTDHGPPFRLWSDRVRSRSSPASPAPTRRQTVDLGGSRSPLTDTGDGEDSNPLIESATVSSRTGARTSLRPQLVDLVSASDPSSSSSARPRRPVTARLSGKQLQPGRDGRGPAFAGPLRVTLDPSSGATLRAPLFARSLAAPALGVSGVPHLPS
jgi:hypothetical protein